MYFLHVVADDGQWRTGQLLRLRLQGLRQRQNLRGLVAGELRTLETLEDKSQGLNGESRN